MDLILETATTGIDSTDVVIELAICDRDYTLLFNERFKPDMRSNRKWEDAEQIHGISPEDVKKCRRFRDSVEEIKRILARNKVIIFRADFDTRMLKYTCKAEGIDYTWVDELKIECCEEKAARYFGTSWITLCTAKSHAVSEIKELQDLGKLERLNLKVPDRMDWGTWHPWDRSAMSNCITAAFVYNVIEKQLEKSPEERQAEKHEHQLWIKSGSLTT